MNELPQDCKNFWTCRALGMHVCGPGKRRQQVTPAMTAEIRWFRSLKEGLVSCASTPDVITLLLVFSTMQLAVTMRKNLL